MKDVLGKVAFITGGASGIGFGLAKVFSSAGMRVVIADIRQDHLDQAMAYFTRAGEQVRPIQLDVTDRDGMERAAQEVESVYGKIHVLCNNAGVQLFGPMDEGSYDDWDWVLGVNLGGVVNGIMAFVPRIKKHGEGGHIVNTASIASFIPGPGAGIYTASKFAVRGISEALRWALAPHGIGVSVFCPGLVKSAIYESDKTRPSHLSRNAQPIDSELRSKWAEVYQIGMEPEEVAEKVLLGIRRNDPYIFTHPEFNEELKEVFADILAALPEGAGDPRRSSFGKRLRRRIE